MGGSSRRRMIGGGGREIAFGMEIRGDKKLLVTVIPFVSPFLYLSLFLVAVVYFILCD